MKLSVVFLSLLFSLLFIAAGKPTQDPEYHYRQGVKHIEDKQYLAAIRDLTQAISLKRDYGDAYYQRAVAKKLLSQQNGYLSMELCYDLILAMDNGNSEASSMLLENCSIECYGSEAAFLDVEKVFCGDFSSQKLKFLPVDMPKLHNLVLLAAYDNALTSLPKNLSELEHLLLLDLSNNKLRRVDEVFKLSQLVELNLPENAIDALSPEVQSMKALRVLNLRNNYLMDLPTELADLQQLENLDLSYNELSHIPEALFKLKNLKALNLFGNDLPEKEIAKLREALPNTKLEF